MEVVPTGIAVGKEQGSIKYKVPKGAKFFLFNPKSKEIRFMVSDKPDKMKLLDDKDYQLLNELTGRWVKVRFKQSEGQFQNVPVK